MQTFLPLPDYLQSMRSLDKYRLGNQVWREGLTLIRGGWEHHPARKMWRGHEYHLGLYLLAGLQVLKERTGKNYPEVRQKIEAEMAKFTDTGAPPWVGDETFHASHRSNLLRKVGEAVKKAVEAIDTNSPRKDYYIEVATHMKSWYAQFGWSEPPTLPYVWPKVA